MDTININNVAYVRADQVQLPPKGSREVVVIDRGWIYAGDVVKGDDGYIYLHRAVWVFKWESVGFDGVIANPKDGKVTIKPMPAGKNIVKVPTGAVIFTVPVEKNWGL